MGEYVKASGRFGLVRLYDPVTAIITAREEPWRPRAVALAREVLPDGGTVLNIGAGTGNSALRFLKGGFEVIAVGGDPEVLAIARSKKGAEKIDWREGFSTDLDLEDGSVDAVNLSLLLHHLPTRRRVRRWGSRRVLRPGGVLIVSDWGPPATLPSRPSWACACSTAGRTRPPTPTARSRR